MKRANVHLAMLLIFFGFFIVMKENYLFPLGIIAGLAIQYYIDDYYANKDKTLRGKNAK
ncbi:hypothetical protein LCGC14_1254860 [marine sediment metagenome]|uniref:Uncharacterized protein n=1 Tax=marine sediment metagenome TaxID=412755 RepID=A0A0F9NJ31_9ZZZZ